jgi:hypothetical protein
MRNLLQWLGMDVLNDTAADNSPAIWRYVSAQTDSNRAQFQGSFDLPLQLLTTERLRLDRDDLLREAAIEAANLDDVLNRHDSIASTDASE